MGGQLLGGWLPACRKSRSKGSVRGDKERAGEECVAVVAGRKSILREGAATAVAVATAAGAQGGAAIAG